MNVRRTWGPASRFSLPHSLLATQPDAPTSPNSALLVSSALSDPSQKGLQKQKMYVGRRASPAVTLARTELSVSSVHSIHARTSSHWLGAYVLKRNAAAKQARLCAQRFR